MSDIDFADISVVMQGPLCAGTKFCLLALRDKLPGAAIILSTWKGSDTADLEYDQLVLNDDPGQETYLDGTKTNLGRQIHSSIEGIRRAETKYCLRLRTDILVGDVAFLRYFGGFERYNDEFKFFKSRILVPDHQTIFNGKGSYTDAQNGFMLYHVSDWCYFGYTDDLRKLFDIPMPEKNPRRREISNSSIRDEHKFRPGAQYCNQQQIFISSLVKNGIDVKFRDWTDATEESRRLSLMYILNNFIILGYRKEYNILNMKYLDLFANRMALFPEWQAMYRKFCDPHYPIPS